MREGGTQVRICIVGIVAFLAAAPLMADWDPGDGHKMHFPQLPDPYGWDVNATYYDGLADDWQCSQSGYVDDIHFWGSWKDDAVGNISFIHTAFWSNDPVGDQGIPGEDPYNTFSKPLARIWHHDNYPGEFTVRWYEDGDQGWYHPGTGQVLPNNHVSTYQYNIADITDPFWQEKDEIYWLETSVRLAYGSTEMWGWKSSINHFMDDAVWGHDEPGTIWENELYEPPSFTQSLDLAFVITPEPCSIGILGLGALVLLRRR